MDAYELIHENPRMAMYRDMNLHQMQPTDVNKLLHSAISMLVCAPRGLYIFVNGDADSWTVALDPRTRSLLATNDSDRSIGGSVDMVYRAATETMGGIVRILLGNSVEGGAALTLLYDAPSRAKRGRASNDADMSDGRRVRQR